MHVVSESFVSEPSESVRGCPTKALNDWCKKPTGVSENFGEFLEILLPWTTIAPDGRVGPSFDCLRPRACDIECTALERCTTFKKNLMSCVFAPLIQMGEDGVEQLIKICERMQEVLNEANETPDVAEEYGDVLDEVDSSAACCLR